MPLVMRTALRSFVLLLPLFALGPLPATARAGAVDAGTDAAQRARQIWQRLSEEERGKLRARYETFRGLDPLERERLELRMEMLRLLKRKLIAGMSEARRQEFGELDPLDQDRLLETVVRSEVRRRGGRIRGKLPREWLRQLQEAGPAERDRVLGEFIRHMRASTSDATIDAIATRLDLAPEEVRRLQQLPWEERRMEMLELRRAEIERRVELEGRPPPGVRATEWEHWCSLSTPDFFELWFGARPQHRSAQERPQLSPVTARAVLDTLSIDRRALYTWRDLSPEVRRERLAEQTSSRLLLQLELSGELSQQQLESLRSLDDRALRQAVRRVAEAALAGNGEPRADAIR